MIIIYHTSNLKQIGKGYDNHDQANTALQAMNDQHIISTHNLAVADEIELGYLRYGIPIKMTVRPHRGRKKGCAGTPCPWKGMKREEYREKVKKEKWEKV